MHLTIFFPKRNLSIKRFCFGSRVSKQLYSSLTATKYSNKNNVRYRKRYKDDIIEM